MTSGDKPALGLTSGIIRKLAAVLSADAAGYSRLMGLDESATLQVLMSHRTIIDTLVRQYRGRVVDSPGDNVLAEFASVVDAVQCAVDIQRELHVRNANLPPPGQLKFRIGINLGDVIVEGDRIYGDGVNIAARMEKLAEAGGICISRSVYEQVKTKLALTYEDIGAQVVKNIADPVRVYRVRDEASVSAPLAIRRRLAETFRRRRVLVAVALLVVLAAVGVWHLVSPSWVGPAAKPSIAVLPFVNMSGDREQEFFSDGMTEDLITEFSRIGGLLVIARASAFGYKGKVVRPEQISRELGVRYLLEGSVRKANNRIRINAQLVDASTGYQMWADSYDRNSEDIFAVQAEIAGMITKTLAVRLTGKERGQMGRPYTSSEVAWEYSQRGLELYRQYTPQGNAHARELFEKAIDLDPKFAKAYAYLAATHRQDGNMEWTSDRQASEDLAYRMAQKAVELANAELDPKPSLPIALQQWGYVLLYRGQRAEALAAAEATIKGDPKLYGDGFKGDPNYADGYGLWAHVLIYSGRPEEALHKTDEAIKRNPNDPFLYNYYRGHAEYVWGFQKSSTDPESSKQHFLKAENYLRTAEKKNSKFRPVHAYLAAVLMELGRHEEARKEMAILAQGGRPRPSQDLARFQKYIEQSLPYAEPAIRTHLIDLWRRADS